MKVGQRIEHKSTPGVDNRGTDYQVMPPLSADEYAALKADIAEHGVLVAVVRDQDGSTLDGHHRERIAAELGISYPVEVREVSSTEDARSVALALNLARRHLTREQKRELIAAEIGHRPDDSDRAIARRLCCDHKTVGTVRRELSGEIPHSRLTAAQRREAGMLFQVMQARTLDAVHRIAAGEPIFAWSLHGPVEEFDDDVYGEASQRFAQWACTSEETRGILWADPDDWIDA